MSSNRKAIPSRRPNLVSHSAHCTICAHPQRQEIEHAYASWSSPAGIAAEYKLGHRATVYRHAHALDLASQRERNLRGALARMIEKIDDVLPTVSAIIQAIALYSRINTHGESIERDQQVGTHDVFKKMSRDELEAYAKDGTLPNWAPRLKDPEDPQSSGGTEDE